jgi:hypothetical protein
MSAVQTLEQPGFEFETEPRSTNDERESCVPRTIVAREGTELAAALRAGGWQARAGWRSSDHAGEPAWQIRFERPEGLAC